MTGDDFADRGAKVLQQLAQEQAEQGTATQRTPVLKSAADLAAQTFQPIKWAVPEIIPEGLTIAAGRPKSGKSWLMMSTAVGVAGGGYALGNVKCIAGDVLYLALEDTDRRLQGRMKALLQGEPAPAALQFSTAWPKADEGGAGHVLTWLREHRASARLVVIDTLAKIRGKPDRNKGVYENDYQAIVIWKRMADHFNVPIVLVHHLNKDTSTNDPLNAVSGTAGLTGAADTIIVLKREPNDPHGLLYVRGRDVNEAEIALEFDKDTGRWTKLGAAADFRKSEERRAVVRAILDAGQPLRPSEIADAIGKKAANVRVLLHKMSKSGDIAALVDGRYAVP